jgi:hypothetical protein
MTITKQDWRMVQFSDYQKVKRLSKVAPYQPYFQGILTIYRAQKSRNEKQLGIEIQ